MKKILAWVLVLAMLTSMLASCGTRNSDPAEDENTLTLLVGQQQHIPLLEAMQEKFPEINFEFEYYSGGNHSYYISERISHGDAGDLICYTVFTSLDEHTSQFYDLSGTSLTGALNDDVIPMLDVNGSIYQIPGPLDTRCISYNKTMFQEYGWEVPNNFDELVELVKQIRIDAPEITPIASAGQAAYYFSIPAAISQAGFLSTSKGYEWEQAFFAGEVSAREGFEEGLAGTQRLIDAGAFDAEKFAGQWNLETAMINREAAMNIQWAGINNLFVASENGSTEDEFGLMPFFGPNEGDKVIVFNSTGYWSINRRLGEPGNEKKLENALKVMEWLTSEEGQNLLRTNKTQIPVTKVDFDMDPRIAELLKYTENGYKAPMMYTGYEHLLVETGNVVAQAVLNNDPEGMAEAFIQTADSMNKEFLENKEVSLYGSYLKDDLNEEQTSLLMTDILLDTGMGDFALSTHTGKHNGTTNYYGTAGTLYAGGINSQDVTTLISESRIMVATLDLTGAEVRTLLEQGKGMYDTEWNAWHKDEPFAENADELPQEYFPYYWSGLDVTMENGKVTSMKLNGVELSDTEIYTVIFTECDYPRAYRDVAVISELMVQDMLVNYFMKTPEINAPEALRK